MILDQAASTHYSLSLHPNAVSMSYLYTKLANHISALRGYAIFI